MIIDWKKFTINVIIAYIVSWGYFFLTLNKIITMFGKTRGAIINYILSWGIMVGIMFILGKVNPQPVTAVDDYKNNEKM